MNSNLQLKTVGNNNMAPHPPTPDDVDQVAFFIRWYQEFLGGIILGVTALYFKSKGKSSESVIVPISEGDIDKKMTICKQALLLAMNEELKERDKELFEHVDKRNKDLLKHIKDLIK